MCGIAGVLYRDANRPVDPAMLQAMASAIAHRGPDAEGFFVAPGIGLVHRRLSIIDLTGGNQPIGNEDGAIQVVYNGEIYNFPAIRRQLEAKGHLFRTRTDAEVLVHLYEEVGMDVPQRLRGMFAFALWDGRCRRLVLARDRIGLKPLYIYRDDEKLLFGSELKAILAHPGVDRRLYVPALYEYLTYGMIGGNGCIFARMQKLPPAHILVVEAHNLHAAPQRYWQLGMVTDRKRTVEEWQEAIRAKVRETVDAHQLADVPVGAFLSGGIDSSVVVAEQVCVGNGSVQTFSIGFREAQFDELPYAREISRLFGTIHTEEVLTAEAGNAIEELARYYDEPFADSSALPTLWLSRLARSRVKVVISGDGGDEAFGGYTRYVHDLWEASLRKKLGPGVRKHLLGTLARWWPKADWLPRRLRAKTMLTNLSLEAAEAYANTLAICRSPDRELLLRGDLRAELNGYRPEDTIAQYYRLVPAEDCLGGMIAADIHTLLPDDFLTKVDRASMSCGLEVRPPLVDHELLELAVQIPSELKVRNGHTKWILKQAYRDVLPPTILHRPKHGFEIPVDRWLRGPLREMFCSLLLARESMAASFVDQKYAEKLFTRHLNRVGQHGPVLWALLIFAAWADRYLRPAAQRTR